MSAELILVVDDEPANLALLEHVLATRGYEVITAVDAESAVSAVARRSPRLILMDLQLPGVDGYELTRRFKAAAATADICIVAVTAYAMPGDDARARSCGCDGYIAKPIDVRRFPDQVADYLAGHRPWQGSAGHLL